MKSQFGKCKFTTWPCKRRSGSYSAGHCFPPENRIAAPEMGYAADKGPSGVYYLTTRSKVPYCGYPLRIGIKLPDYETARGIFSVKIHNGNSSIYFRVHIKLV